MAKSILRTSLIILATSVLLTTNISQITQATKWNQNRHNLFDPLYAFDDVDAHYVSPSLSSSSASSLAPSSTSTSPRQTSSVSVAEQQLRTLLRQTKEENNQASSLKPIIVQEQVSQGGVLTKTTPSLIASTGRTISQLNPANVQVSQQTDELYDGVKPTTAQRTNKKEDEPHYWSALENYYWKLQQHSQQQPQYPTYKIIQQEIDDSINEYKPNSYPALNSVAQFYNHHNNQQQQQQQQQPKINPAFFLPLVGSSQTLTGVKQPQQQQEQQQQIISANDQDQVQYAPGVSRTGGIGAGSILMAPRFQQSSGNNQQIQQLPISINEGGSGLVNAAGPLATVDENGRVKYLEWRKLPDVLLYQQQQQRVRHQEDTFGSWYDPQRSRESLQEEAFCGPRNYINLNQQISPPVSGNSSSVAATVQQQILLARLQAQQQQPVAPSAGGEYPSHMGLYNGSINDDNFLCAATWIHERFALTLASCVKNIQEPGKLMFRLGEWNLNRNLTGERPMVSGDIDQVYVFPKYRNDSFDHDLALVRFAKPVDFLAVPYVWPACQLQSRTLLRTNSCWAPSRNISLIEYFDAEGEGETKERKSVSMVQLPVRLMANNELECQRETKVEFFNFQHPNYICSGDYRKSVTRARLNNSNTFGSGIYCHEQGNLALVSIVHPIHPNSSSSIGYMDLSYYRPWMRNIISGRNY